MTRMTIQVLLPLPPDFPALTLPCPALMAAFKVATVGGFPFDSLTSSPLIRTVGVPVTFPLDALSVMPETQDLYVFLLTHWVNAGSLAPACLPYEMSCLLDRPAVFSAG